MYKFISVCTGSQQFFEMYFFVDGFKLCFYLKLIVNFTSEITADGWTCTNYAVVERIAFFRTLKV
jgi:hypothetical protein